MFTYVQNLRMAVTVPAIARRTASAKAKLAADLVEMIRREWSAAMDSGDGIPAEATEADHMVALSLIIVGALDGVPSLYGHNKAHREMVLAAMLAAAMMRLRETTKDGAP
jgi:hypothetical protein